MGINITHTMNNSHFENKENLRQAAKNILSRQGATDENLAKIIDKTIFANNNYSKPEHSILATSTQITLNNNLKETLKYLKNQANKKNAKKHILGELWNIAQKETNNYQGELLDFEIDSNAINIFIAA